MRTIFFAIAATLALSACQTTTTANGKSVNVYRISSAKTSKIQYRVLDSVNELRRAAGAGPVELNSRLTAAAATHARDMEVQNRPWNFGSDGSSPLERARRAGYSGLYIGENIAETFESELQILSAWMNEPATRRIILDPRATNMGFSWNQQRNGKIWWVLEMGG